MADNQKMSTAQIRELKDLELHVFNYLIAHYEEVENFTVREVAGLTHVSAATVVRMAEDLGFDGWTEMKYYIKSSKKKVGVENKGENDYRQNVDSFLLFSKKLSSKTYERTLQDAVSLISKSRRIIFVGLGTSEILGDYGARYFANCGLSAFSFGDIFRPVGVNEFTNATSILLSVSGETEQILIKALELKKSKSHLIAITNNKDSSLAKIADVTLSYQVNEVTNGDLQDFQLTTQLPVIALLEILANRASSK